MSKYSPDEVASYVAKAMNATENALGSIKRAYLPPCQGAPAAFILTTCLIDFLGTLYAGSESKESTFRAFVCDFMTQEYDGAGYNDKELYRSLRSKLVHNYSIWRGKYVLTHGRPERHLKPYSGKARILNLVDFFKDVEQAAGDYFARVAQETKLQDKLSDRISTLGTIADVEIEGSRSVPENHRPSQPSLTQETEPRAEELSPEQINRLWEHGMHEDEMLNNRLQFFLVLESVLLAVAGMLLSNLGARRSATATQELALRLFMLLGLGLTVIWAYVQARQLYVFNSLRARMREHIPDYAGTVRDRARARWPFSNLKLLTYVVPSLFILIWIALEFVF